MTWAEGLRACALRNACQQRRMLLHDFASARLSPTCKCSDLSSIAGALKVVQDGEKKAEAEYLRAVGSELDETVVQ